MQPNIIPRNPIAQNKTLELSDLNDDVIFEILLSFVAIDWDGGPFTLMMVCRKWQEMVLSKPRLWTWILVDDLQADWKERMVVAADLSRGLPLQIRLRLPFVSDTPVSPIVHRCEVLFVESPHSGYDSSMQNWESETITPYWGYDLEEVKHVNDSVMHFLADTPTNRIKIFVLGRDRHCFRYSAWEIHEQIVSGTSVKTLLGMAHPFLVTALVFKHPRRSKSPRVHFEIGEVWALLPTLPHLSHLELYDKFVNMDRQTILPRIRLPSLLTLTIDCPMTHWLFFSFTHDLWLGLLTLLTSLDAPTIDAITLHGSIHRIQAAMIKATTRPSDLTLSISTFDEAADEPMLTEGWVWQGVRRVTVNLPENPKSFSRLKMPDGVASTIQSLLSLLPKGISKRFRGGGELDAIACSYADGVEDLSFFYVHGRDLDYNFSADNVTTLAVRSSGTEYRSHQLYIQWLKSAKHISFHDYGKSVNACFAAYLFHVPEPVLKSWNSDVVHIYDHQVAVQRGTFSYLTTLRCAEDVANSLVRCFDTPCLQSITLTAVDPHCEMLLDVLPDTLLKHASQLKQLTILRMEVIPDWSALFGFLSNFRKARREIATIDLPGLPHPSILRPLVEALQGGSPVHETAELRQRFNEIREFDDDPCEECFMSGFLCHDREECQRFWSGHMVSITKDTVIEHYEEDGT